MFGFGKKKRQSELEVTAFLSGKVIPIAEVPDQVFSQKMLGDGLAIDPTDDVLLAPVSGEVAVTMPESNHAVGIRLTNGMEILLHIGLDTVAMQGDGFKSFVKQGDLVKQGDKLIQFDPDKIREAGHPTITVLVVTEVSNGKNLKFVTGGDAVAGETVVLTYE